MARILEEAGLLRSGHAFSAYLRFSGRAKRLVPGVYRLKGEGAFRLARALTGGVKPLSVTLTFPEGERAVDYARRLSQAGLDGEGFLRLVERPGALKPPTWRGGPWRATSSPPPTPLTSSPPPRRWCGPCSAALRRSSPPGAEASRGAGAFRPRLGHPGLHRGEGGGKRRGDALYRRGLPEPPGAGHAPPGRPHGGLRLGEEAPGAFPGGGGLPGGLPYNTYRYGGLPPGPIANPGRKALLAVLNPVRQDERGRPYLYFFHAQGRLYLNVDFAGHLRDLARYRYASPSP